MSPGPERPSISVVIPARDESATIQRVVEECRRFATEVIVVDDGSNDATAAVAAEAGATVIDNGANHGYVAALKAGIRAASGDIVVSLDADGEHRPEDIPKLVAPLLDDRADLVFGLRDRVPRPSERLINRLVRARAGGLSDTGTGFRAMRRELAVRLELRGSCTCGILALEAVALGARLAGVPVASPPVAKARRIAWGHLAQGLRVLLRLRLTDRVSPGRSPRRGGTGETPG